jgi:hypothetical protein
MSFPILCFRSRTQFQGFSGRAEKSEVFSDVPFNRITDGMGSATVYIPENTGYSEISIIADGFNPHYERIETPYSGEMKRIDGANRVAFLKRTLEASSDGSAGTSAGESAGDAARGAMPEHGDLKKPNGLVWIAAGALGLWWWFKGKN